MEAHVNLSDDEFENQFKRCELPPAVFSHEAHLRLVWIHITRYGFEKALQTIPEHLMRYVYSLGAQGKYNTTLTIAAVNIVNHFMMKGNSESFSDFINEFPRLKTQFKDLITQHYKVDIFNSDEAKMSFIEPDLLPFSN